VFTNHVCARSLRWEGLPRNYWAQNDGRHTGIELDRRGSFIVGNEHQRRFVQVARKVSWRLDPERRRNTALVSSFRKWQDARHAGCVPLLGRIVHRRWPSRISWWHSRWLSRTPYTCVINHRCHRTNAAAIQGKGDLSLYQTHLAISIPASQIVARRRVARFHHLQCSRS
jgi:hypothetical protein